ncbi:hypothetical protein BRETT_001623 [Brettanomyces bruxellensis]|uniref:Hikeshi-like domain-containing protein n=1 Tax=Dekkera bruxellensis TaxID=5007 RepID=A0A871R8W8_DEKBR|nr:uncharacterized protein BRETT_001623 [Brettanomyces bruxellensis]QOU18560.1 hypothetical protein BRETT_001623 [Brettanomyces bruxellensis]
MFASTLGGRPLKIAQQIESTKFTLTYDDLSVKDRYYLSLFVLPNVPFDPAFTALIYYQFQVFSTGSTDPDRHPTVSTEFKLLGGLNFKKQSAIFKVNPGNIAEKYRTRRAQFPSEGDIDMDLGMDVPGNQSGLTDQQQSTASITIGISVEPTESASSLLEQQKTQSTGNSSSMVVSNKPGIKSGSGSALALSNDLTQSQVLDFSNKIIANAFNFLSSFADVNNKVSMDKFNDWWNKFKSRMTNDPDYLKRLCDAQD